jgi:hypothetical protein
MTQATIKEVKKGEFFKRKEDAQTVYVRGNYDASSKTFSAYKFDDINSEIFIKPSKIVFINFDF